MLYSRNMVIQPASLLKFQRQLDFSQNSIQPGDLYYQFGRNPMLSLGELLGLQNFQGKPFHAIDLCDHGVFVRNPYKIPISMCGSTLRRGTVIGMLSLDIHEISAEISPFIEHILYNHVFLEEKCNWTISMFNFPDSVDTDLIREETKKLVKKGIKSQGIKRAFYIKGQEQENVAPRRLNRKQVIENGMEILLVYWNGAILMIITEEVIDVDGMHQRDLQRPHRRPLLLLGLAVARSMINLIGLGQPSKPIAIYDPFCGMGSIPGEAYCLGYHAYGSDIDRTCVSQSKANLAWLSQQKQFHTRIEPFPLAHIFPMDITKPVPKFSDSFPGAIVTEPNLLTPRTDYPTIRDAKIMMAEFESNYFHYFEGLRQVLKPNQIGVVIFPRIHTNQDERVTFNVGQLLASFDCEIIHMTLNQASQPAIFIHAWKKHIIEREIVVFRKN